MSDQEKTIQINIKVDEELQKGRYSNAAQISHSAEEFTIDFFYLNYNPPFGTLLSRIILSPSHAKRLLLALQENIQSYESNFGEIAVAPKPPGSIDFVQ